MTRRARSRELRQHVTTRNEESAAGEGKPLAQPVANAAAAQFAHSFANVRVHADAEGDEVAREHEARAVTIGRDLFFRDGSYAPETPGGARVLAHELAHVVQQAPNDAGTAHVGSSLGMDYADAEAQADTASDAVTRGGEANVASGSVAAGTPQAWPWDDDAPAPESAAAAPASGGSLWDSVGSLASGAWDATKGAAGTVYDSYQKSTNFTALQKGDAKAADAAKGQFGESFIRGGINGAIDDWETMANKGNDQMVKEAEGHWYSPLAKASSWMNKTSTEVTGGLLKGVGDIGFGVANAVAHPIDAAGGLLGIAEHDLPMVGSVLKGAHGLADLGLDAAGVHYEGQGQYGKSFGELGNHLFNPLQQAEDDAKFNTNLVQGVVDPDRKGWAGFKDKPVETITRALTNIAPIALGVGEAAGAEATEGATAASKVPPVVGDPPPTLRTPYLPEGVPAPKPFNPDIPVVNPPEIPGAPKVINPGGGPVQINPTHPIYPDAGAPTVMPPTVEIPPETLRDPFPAPKAPGEPITPQPQPKLPGAPKEGPPIPREEPPSGPVDTQRTPIDIPNVPGDEPLPSTKPRPAEVPDGPITQDAPASSQRSAVPTERGIGPIHGESIPRGFDPGALIQLLLDTPGGGNVTQLLKELGMPIQVR